MQIYFDRKTNTVYIDEGSRETVIRLSSDDYTESIVTEVITQLIGDGTHD